ncbi:polyphosphate kinase 1 [Thalassotalea profundi]|uniref:Polyphosphate kinase n=1 Tax=Thalassotalea profundi TaxID=2036687 RepID=A0ABQ3IF93_9GAMM|nr:polyphosphate kinase 1 [Thalassotalea profundi]GHE81471.1 polyphosphate kinase [Thalassotalea profundi]
MFEGQSLFEKELSWLSFNERVLQEANDESVPLIERIRFLGIYSSNLDEFFRVRVAGIRRRAILETAQGEPSGKWSHLQFAVTDKVEILTAQFQKTSTHVFSLLQAQGIHTLYDAPDALKFDKYLTPTQISWLEQVFDNRIIRHITPIVIHSKTQLTQCIDDDGIYFLVALNKGMSKQFCLVEIPRVDIERFIIVPTNNGDNPKYIVILDDVVEFFIDKLFAGMFDYDHIDAYSLKLTRDAEYNLTDDLDESLLDQMSKGIKQRLKADMVRLVHDRKMPKYMLSYLRKSLKIREHESLSPSVRYRHFKDFMKFPSLNEKCSQTAEIKALESIRFNAFNSVFDAISYQDILLYYPYHKFKHFTEFVRQASYDPLVKHIKINIYRVAKNSRIIQSLVEAVKNGKRVSVVVELRARFDEQANIEWAKTMKDAGIDVEFGIESLKVHAKLCVVTRLENEKMVRYTHIGTGNFHEANARVYTDFALFTKHKEISQEVDNVFDFIEHSYKRFRFNHLIVSPLTSRRRIYQLIDNETNAAEQGQTAEISIKLNNLVDPGIINKLYQASNAGVKIRIIVRGMCALIPGVKEYSKNIKVISIVDRYLEHPRIMFFHNAGNEQLFISSADWMERNLDERVEVACPIYDLTIKTRIIEIFNLQFNDNVKARIINKEQNNLYVKQGSNPPIRSQIEIYHYLVEKEKEDSLLLLEKLNEQ